MAKHKAADMSGAREGSAKPFPNMGATAKTPGNSYGKGKKSLQPSKARRQSYTPNTDPYCGGNG